MIKSILITLNNKFEQLGLLKKLRNNIRRKFFSSSKSREMQKLRKDFYSCANKLLKLAEEFGIKNQTIFLKDGDLFFQAENGIDFAYVPDFGIRHLEFNGTNDRLQIEFILKNLDNKSVFFDIGASYGYYGLSVAKAISDSKVYCFEAVPSTYFWLTKNIKRNKIDNIIALQKAVGEKDGKVNVTSDSFGGDFIFIENSLPPSNTDEIDCIKLDTFVKSQNISRIDYIKIDVEGSELLVLKGAIETIDHYKPIIQLEVSSRMGLRFGYKPDDIFKLLFKMNYDYLFLGKYENDNGVGKLQTSSGDIYIDMKKSTEFFFIQNDCDVNLSYDSKYTEPLKFPYI